MQLYSKIILLIKTSRPLSWALVLIFSAGHFDSQAPISLKAILQFLSFSIPFGLFSNGINDIYDYQSDIINPRKTNDNTVFVFGKVLDPKYHSFVKRCSLISGLFVFIISVITLNCVNITLVFILLIVTYFYSAPPLRLKNYPPMDLLSLLLAFLVFYLSGYTFGNPFLTEIPVEKITNLCTWSLGLLGFVTLANMTDYESDKEAKVQNCVVSFGMRANSVFIFLCFLTASIFVRLEFKPMLYYIYFITIIYCTLIFKPTSKYAKILIYFTILTYLPILFWYIYSLAEKYLNF